MSRRRHAVGLNADGFPNRQMRRRQPDLAMKLAIQRVQEIEKEREERDAGASAEAGAPA